MKGGEPRIAREEDIRQAWHAASDESPPPALDAAILAAARDAAHRPGRANDATRVRPWYQAWQPMLAAAGVAALAFVLVQTMPRDAREAMPLGQSAPAVEPAESSELPTTQERQAPAGKVEQPARRDSSPATLDETRPGVGSSAGSRTFAGEMEPDRAKESAEGVEQRPTSPAAPPPAAATAAAPPPDVADSMLSSPPPAVATRERAAAPGEHAQTAAGVHAEAGKSAVDTRIEHIVALYQSGDRSGAATELRALRVEVPGVDARLPATLQAWARTVH